MTGVRRAGGAEGGWVIPYIKLGCGNGWADWWRCASALEIEIMAGDEHAVSRELVIRAMGLAAVC